MFYKASSFNQPLFFDTSNVLYMDSEHRAVSTVAFLIRSMAYAWQCKLTAGLRPLADMFNGALAFGQPLAFNPSSLVIMEGKH